MSGDRTIIPGCGPYVPKIGPVLHNLIVNEDAQLVFFIDLPKGAKYVGATPYPRKSEVMTKSRPVALGVLVIYSADMDETIPLEPRNVIFMLPGTWMEGVEIVGHFRSITNGEIYAIAEAPANEEQLKQWHAARAAAPSSEQAEIVPASKEVADNVLDFLARRRNTPENKE